MNPTAYLARLDYHGSTEPTLETLRALQRAHLLAVPFENLDIHLGRPIIIDPARFYDKIVNQRRGGFCYELNGLFAALLRALGFTVTCLAARVADGAGGWGPEFDHLTLLVHLDERWLADVGFGDSFIEPLRLDDPAPQSQAAGLYQITHTADLWWLSEQNPQGHMTASYQFTLQPRALIDFADTCRYQQTPPAHFTQKTVCSRATPTGRVTLSGERLILTDQGQRTEQVLTPVQSTLALQQYFGMTLDWPLPRGVA